MKRRLLLLITLLIGCASTSEWPFQDPPSTIVVTQQSVIDKKRPILFVLHDREGDWQFLSNEKLGIDLAVELSLRDLVAFDSSITQLAQLKRGWKATRTDYKSPWNISLYE